MDQELFLLSVLLLTLLMGSGCPQEEEFEQLNRDDDCFVVEIGPDLGGSEEPPPFPGFKEVPSEDDESEESGSSIDLIALPGIFSTDVVGSASMSPAEGPAGTRFFMSVVLDDNGEAQDNPTAAVDRVTVKADNGPINLDEFEMDPSPADESRWTLTLSAGGDSETSTRRDSLCVALYAGMD